MMSSTLQAITEPWRMESLEVPPAAQRKLFGAFVEMAQNVQC